ncbi:BppU family phage baseplate upper protein [Staphylococcus haemolyticus]|uniref:BppU family phage baseplate upper protein n=1 Tax=Staphylococcus haemolyticus TaxID=1283 RepID=UPI00069DEA20|nr:BppU family phage baseplate upper protein [Staphylococcus haemolyticus]
MDYKLKDININFTAETAEIGDINTRFYTEDDGSAYIRMTINGDSKPFDFTKTDLVPKLTLFAKDGSIFGNELVEIVLPDKGVIQYKVSDNVIKHAGRMNAILLLVNDERSIHAANFYFTIKDSGLIGAIGKEIEVDSLKSIVKEVMSNNAMGLLTEDYRKQLLDNIQKFLLDNEDTFKGKAGDIPEEIVDARGRSNSLKEEMDRIENKTYTKNSNKVRPLVSFYLDDGYQNDYDVVYPKAKSLNIPITACLYNTSELLSTPDKLNELIDNGWEIHSHTAHHVDLDKMTYEEQKKEMYDNIMYYKNIGIDLKGICYPKGYSNEHTPKAARQFFEVGMSSIPGINSSPIDTYYVKRDLTDQTDMNKMKERVDKILADGKGWLVFYSHTNIFKQNTEVRDRYFEMMDYVKSKDIECATVHDAMKVYGNTLDIGDVKYSENYLKVGSDGVLDTSNLPIIYNKNLTNVSSIKGTDFKDGKITITSFDLSKKSDIPFDSGVGTLYTDRRFELNEYGQRAFQRFEGIDGTIVQRVYNGGKWSDWSTVGGMNTVRGTFNSASVITDFPKFKRTTFAVLAGDNAGFPEQIGTVETNRFSSADVLGYQLFYPYNRNYFYKRYWTTNGWSDWDKISSTLGLAQSFDFGDIEANSTRTYSFTINGVNDNDVPSINFSQGLANGLIPFIYTAGNNTIVVKIINVYNNKTTIGTRPIRIKVLKN